MSSGSLWGTLRSRKGLIGYLIIGVLLFGAGWQTGRIMSPYYASHPIIFEDRAVSEGSGETASGGGAAELTALQEQGRGVVTPTPPVVENSEEKTPSVAGTAVERELSSENNEENTNVEQRFVGSVNSDLFHDPSCSSARRIKEENQIWFASVDDARAAGYTPSKCTEKLLGL